MGIELGQKVRDIVTGFEGVATARVTYLNGCIQYCVKPGVDEKGKMIEGEYIDEGQLVIVEAENLDIEQEPNGGPMSDEPPESYSG